MNKVILMGRLTKNPEIKYAGKDNDMAVARYTLAVNRRFEKIVPKSARNLKPGNTAKSEISYKGIFPLRHRCLFPIKFVTEYFRYRHIR